MMVIRFVVCGVILWLVAKYQWQAIVDETPLPWAYLQVMLCALALGVITVQSATLDMRRQMQRAQGRAPAPRRPWLPWLIAVLIGWMVFASLWGRVDWSTFTFRPNVDPELHKLPVGILIFFVVGLFLHGGARSREISYYRAETRKMEGINARLAAHNVQSKADRKAVVEEERGREIAESLWGGTREPERGSVPTVQRATAVQAPMKQQKQEPYERTIVNGEWQLRTGEKVLVGDANIPIAFHYRDFTNVETDRTVMARAIIGRHHRNGDVTVTRFGGHCDLRDADRQFEIERVTLASDPETGKEVKAIGSWLYAQAGRTGRVRPIETLASEWTMVAPTEVELALDLSRGREEALEHFTVLIDTVFQPGLAFEGLATRHKTATVPGWKGRKRFAVAPDGTVSLLWMKVDGRDLPDIPQWLAALPPATSRIG